MELHLQFGWGMMAHSHALIREWAGGTVILSPRDLTDQQLHKISARINALPSGHVMVDPQTFMPNANHSRLVAHDYWINDYVTGNNFSGLQLRTLLAALRDLNDGLATSAAILPGILASEITQDWLDAQRMIYEEAVTLGFNQPIVQTIALSADAARNTDQITQLMEYIGQHPAERYYLVCEHPEGKYLVDDVAWIANVLDIVAGLKILGAKVTIGYSSHQMLIAANAKADAIASGTWMNVRSFPPEKFQQAYEDEIKQRSVWYYAVPTLSEYKIPTLDGARMLGRLGELSCPNASAPVAALFSGVQPTTVGLSEPDAFQHYLSMLRAQAMTAVKGTFDETTDAYEQTLTVAEGILAGLAGSRINGQLRDFSLCLDPNRVALEILKANRGPVLRHDWDTI